MPSDDVAIRVEGLGKRYLVPQKHEQNYRQEPTMRRKLKEFFPSLLGAGETDFFWALRDVSFEVKRGEILGVVGENGSGKSTLLKILSGVTPPTEGNAEIRGRVGSLLEVGTGFHPDLTGRENILFNGSLLGIRTAEIRTKLDAIIDFSGIGEFIDVPVKRYSSGMYVRLAYAVASLLQSEIMIFDEVLAVGDAAFREKSEQNIKENALGGRTVLFVSHNPRAVATICDRAIILYKGRVVFEGPAKDVMSEYLSNAYKPPEPEPPVEGEQQTSESSASGQRGEQPAHSPQVMAKPRTARSFVNISKLPRQKNPNLLKPWRVLRWVSVHALDGERQADFSTGDGVRIRVGYEGLPFPEVTYFSVIINNSAQDRVSTIYSTDNGPMTPEPSGVIECVIPELMLAVGLFNVWIDCGKINPEPEGYFSYECVPYATYIRIKDAGFITGAPRTEFQGVVHRTEWSAIEAPVQIPLEATVEEVEANEADETVA